MSNPVIIVIGAGPGVGTATARRFARHGYDVGLIARDAGRLTDLARSLEADGTAVGWAAADAGDPQALGGALSRMIAHTGRLDVLLHNAVAFRATPAIELAPEDLLADLGVGTASLLTAVQAALPTLREQRTGTVLVTGGGAADRPMTGAASLGVQKAAVRNLVQVLAGELRGDGVHVATVTIRGVIESGTPFAPDRIADLMAELAEETAGPPGDWRTVVDFTG